MRRYTVGLLVVAASMLLNPVIVDAQGWQSAAQNQGMPAPWGLGLTIYDQRQPYRIDQLEFQLTGLSLLSLEDLEVDSRTTTYHLKFDYWVLPFLNVYVLGGQVEGSTTVKLNDTELGLPVPLSNIRVKYDGWVYGIGATLAAGWDNYFVTLTYDLNETDLSTSDSTVRAEVITPRFGYQNKGTAVYFGGMHQKAEEEHTGSADVTFFGEVPFKVSLREKEAWNYLVGMTTELGEHFVLTCEGFFGDREAVLVMLDYRWGR
ncbi:MAG: hypothetical protein GY906_37685 [bacterium]|nr:hypothetical protein [bacterium]